MNLPECGMRYKPAVYRLKFNDQCFKNALPFKSRTVYDVGIGIRLEDEPLQPTDESLEDDFPEEVVPKNRVFKGAEAEYGEAPWTVLIKVNRIDVVDIKGKKFAKKIDIGVCTGVLVAYEWIVTAATCLMEGSVSTFLCAASSLVSSLLQNIHIRSALRIRVQRPIRTADPTGIPARILDPPKLRGRPS